MSTPRQWRSRQSKQCAPAPQLLCRRIGKRRTSNGWKTSSHGVFHANFGGVTKFQLGMAARKLLTKSGHRSQKIQRYLSQKAKQKRFITPEKNTAAKFASYLLRLTAISTLYFNKP